MEGLGKWFCTDDDGQQHLRRLSNTMYECIEMVWLDTCEGDEGYPDKEYTVKTAIIDLDDYTEEEKEFFITAYYDGTLDEIRKALGEYFDQILVECIFEEMTDGSATTHGMMAKEEAIDFIKKYIKEREG